MTGGVAPEERTFRFVVFVGLVIVGVGLAQVWSWFPVWLQVVLILWALILFFWAAVSALLAWRAVDDPPPRSRPTEGKPAGRAADPSG